MIVKRPVTSQGAVNALQVLRSLQMQFHWVSASEAGDYFQVLVKFRTDEPGYEELTRTLETMFEGKLQHAHQDA